MNKFIIHISVCVEQTCPTKFCVKHLKFNLTFLVFFAWSPLLFSSYSIFDAYIPCLCYLHKWQKFYGFILFVSVIKCIYGRYTAETDQVNFDKSTITEISIKMFSYLWKLFTKICKLWKMSIELFDYRIWTWSVSTAYREYVYSNNMDQLSSGTSRVFVILNWLDLYFYWNFKI